MDKSKRNLAKALGVAGASTAVWSKPAVDSVTLPAHANTTTPTCAGCVQLDNSPPSYVNFCDIGRDFNYLSPLDPLYSDSQCANQIDSIGENIVYAPEGIAQATPLCMEGVNESTAACFQRDNPDIWQCGGGGCG